MLLCSFLRRQRDRGKAALVEASPIPALSLLPTAPKALSRFLLTGSATILVHVRAEHKSQLPSIIFGPLAQQEAGFEKEMFEASTGQALESRAFIKLLHMTALTLSPSIFSNTNVSMRYLKITPNIARSPKYHVFLQNCKPLGLNENNKWAVFENSCLTH